MDATLGSAARRRTRFVAPLITLLLLSSCAAPGLETSRSAPREDPEFAIVFGDDGVAMTDGHWIEQLQLDSSEGIPPGPEAVGLDASRACPFTGGPWCHVVAGVGSQGLPVRALWMASMARMLWPRVLTR